MNRSHHTWLWLVAGASFAAYPLLRPYGDDSTLSGLAAMASGRWVLAHVLGMVGFAVLPVALDRLGRTRVEQGSRSAGLVGPVSWLGTVLVLPYYGGEAYGLHAIGRRAVATADVSMAGLVDDFRYDPVALTLFGVGLLAYVVVGVVLVGSTWGAGLRWRSGGALVGLALVTYLPQFFAPAPVRMAHGVLLGLGCVALALASHRRRPRQARPTKAPGVAASG